MTFWCSQRSSAMDDYYCYAVMLAIYAIVAFLLHIALTITAICFSYMNDGLFDVAVCGPFLIISLLTGVVYYGLSAIHLAFLDTLRATCKVILHIIALSAVVSSFLSLYYLSSAEQDTLFYVAVSHFHYSYQTLLNYEDKCVGLDILGDACGDNCCDSALKDDISTRFNIIMGTSLTSGIIVFVHFLMYVVVLDIMECLR